ncbi:hypothetical protein HRbin12_01384 [bacterium HR12]|nr:hypothetical protein HRbin12_01384 [bacterium HR12]
MERGLIRDLERWERGELPLEALEAAHGARARTLAELHGRLAALGADPVPSPEVAWAELAPRLPARGSVAPLPARRLPRALVAAAAAAAVALALGVATPSPVRHELLSFFERVRAALGLEAKRSGPGIAPPSDGLPTPVSPAGGASAPAGHGDEPDAVGAVEDEDEAEAEDATEDDDPDEGDDPDGTMRDPDDRDDVESDDVDADETRERDADEIQDEDPDGDLERDAED